jgi:hypothetical protein
MTETSTAPTGTGTAASPPAPITAAAVLADIVDSRGGPGVFNLVDMAVARSLVAVLIKTANGDATKAPTIAALSALLPPLQQKADAAPVDFDLKRLSDKEFAFLEYLCARARGEKPERPDRRSVRQAWADMLARRIDHIEAENRTPTEDELNDIRNDVHAVLGLVVPIPVRLWPESAKELARALAAAAPASPAPPLPKPGAPSGDDGGARSNVVPLARTQSRNAWNAVPWGLRF